MSEKKILVVSEDESLRKKIIEFLMIASPDHTGFGVSTLTAIDEQLAQNGPFAILITEYKLATFSGFDVMGKILKNNPQTVVIITPERNQIKELQSELINNPVHDVLCKPLNMKYLQQVIKMGISNKPRQR